MTYSQMVEYVARVTDPIEAHMASHDVWHREQLTIAQQQGRTNRIAMLGIWVAVAALIAGIVLPLVFRH